MPGGRTGGWTGQTWCRGPSRRRLSCTHPARPAAHPTATRTLTLPPHRYIGAALALTLLPLALLAAYVLPRRPSHDREWTAEQARLPRVRVVGDTVHVEHLRDFRYRQDGPADQRWADATWDAGAVRRVWFVLSPFNARFRALAHPFLSFEFDDGRFLAASVEARKEVGESYSAVGGLLRRFETIMVLGTEEDLLGLRAIAWGDPLYLFPVRITRAQASELFRLLMARARELEQRPEFYNTLSNNCTTNLIAPINSLAADERRIGRLVGLMPGYSYETAFERGWIDTELSLEEARRAFFVNERVRAAAGRPDFSAAIRAGLPATAAEPTG